MKKSAQISTRKPAPYRRVNISVLINRRDTRGQEEAAYKLPLPPRRRQRRTPSPGRSPARLPAPSPEGREPGDRAAPRSAERGLRGPETEPVGSLRRGEPSAAECSGRPRYPSRRELGAEPLPVSALGPAPTSTLPSAPHSRALSPPREGRRVARPIPPAGLLLFPLQKGLTFLCSRRTGVCLCLTECMYLHVPVYVCISEGGCFSMSPAVCSCVSQYVPAIPCVLGCALCVCSVCL